MKALQTQIDDLKKAIEADGIQKTVVGAVIRREDAVLLLKRSADDFMGGLIELPSGAVDAGEEIIEALEREVLEETGLAVAAVKAFIGSFDYVSGSGKKTRQLNFLVEVGSGEVSLNPEEHSQSYWIDPADKEFQILNISAETRRAVLAGTNPSN